MKTMMKPTMTQKMKTKKDNMMTQKKYDLNRNAHKRKRWTYDRAKKTTRNG